MKGKKGILPIPFLRKSLNRDFREIFNNIKTFTRLGLLILSRPQVYHLQPGNPQKQREGKLEEKKRSDRRPRPS